jgi:tetratricopeptide (TPR) repeat protein
VNGRGLLLVIYLCFASSAGFTQEDQAAKANSLWSAGKKLDALPLYEELTKSNPRTMIYFERLVDCLGAQEMQTDDPAQAKAIRVRERDEARRAVALGDTTPYIVEWSNLDPETPRISPSDRAGSSLLKQAEKAFGAGEFTTAMAKYAAAADADPKLYDAPLFAGDTALQQKDLKAAAMWFSRAIQVDPNRETAYRYWGDSLMRLGGDPMMAKEKFIDGIVAEPYSKYAWQGIQQWAQIQKAEIQAPQIERPTGPVTDPKKPNNVTINIDPTATDDKKHLGGSAWLMYSIVRAGYRGDQFKKDFPNEKEYRHSLKEEDSALSLVASSVDERHIKSQKLDESLRNLVELNKAGMLDCWILISGADQGIAQDYDAFRKEHRQLLHDYLERFVVHDGSHPGD